MIDAVPDSASAPSGAGDQQHAVSCAGLRDWVRGAQRGAQLSCGEGITWALAAGPAVARLVGELAEKGFLTPHRQRNPETRALLHLVQRTQRRLVPGEVL